MLVLAFVNINQASRYFGKHFWDVKHAIPLLADISTGRGLSDRVAEKRHAAKPVLRHATRIKWVWLEFGRKNFQSVAPIFQVDHGAACVLHR